MKELEYIIKKYNLDIEKRSPIEIPNVGRDSLGYLFDELDYKVGVEIGVERGVYSEVLCQGNPNMLLYGIDPWRAYKGYRDHVSQDKLDNFYRITADRMRNYNYVPVKSFSQDALKLFDDGSLDFVYIDGNHDFINVSNDLWSWSKKVRIGGIVAGHDYRENKRFSTSNHVVYVINAFMRSYRVHPWFLLGTKKQVPGEIRDKNRSWFYVKEFLKDK